jgi:hypothetical protein
MRRLVCAATFAAGLSAATPASAYSVLAHEAAIDVVWDTGIRPLLVRRFPRATPEALLQARSFAYGGSVIQDLGYYPFGNKFFSNLLHYVRSGDFVETLIHDANDIDEYAFALGALAHYANDNTGHPEATNRAVPIIFPKLHAKYGDSVTYVQAPKEHVIVEFSFDVVQAAGGTYLPDAYRSFIGFRVATSVLERAFRDTYGLEMKDIFRDEDRAISTYRYAVSQLIPALTNAAWRDKHDEIAKLIPGVERGGFMFVWRRSDFEKAYGTNYQRPGLMARFLGILYRILPKVGPLKPLAFKAPSLEVEAMFAQSFRNAAGRYRAALGEIAAGRVEFANTDFDTGRPARHGEYSLADDTYGELVERFAKHSVSDMPDPLRQNVIAFYGLNPRPSMASKRERKRWPRLEAALAELNQRSVRR